MAGSAPAPVKSAMRTLDVIELVVAHRKGITANEIGAALTIPVSSLSYLLATLADRDYLRREGRQYLPGPGLERLRVPLDELSLEDRVAPLLRAIRSELNETASFFVRQGWDMAALVTEASAQALRYAIEPGELKPTHALAAGKALLATLSEGELAQYFAEARRDSLTERTVCSEAGLRSQLAEIRARGYAEAIEESTEGICSLGCAIAVGGKTVGAIGVAIPTVRFDGDLRARTVVLLRRTAEALSGA